MNTEWIYWPLYGADHILGDNDIIDHQFVLAKRLSNGERKVICIFKTKP